MNRIAKLVAPVALFAAFGVANAGEIAAGDINLKPVMGGSSAASTAKIVGAPSGEGAFGVPGTVAAPAKAGVEQPMRSVGERIVQPRVVGA
jgi:type IV secretory pathway TrbL component